MPEVTVNGVVYVPRAEVPPLNDERLQEALKVLVSIQYFRESHKAIAQAWNALHILAPELADLASLDPEAAYTRMHGDDR